MSTAPTTPPVLYRIDAARNMARFYCLWLQPTLFGEISVVRAWGRIGTGGRLKMESFSTADKAAAALIRLERTKRRRGYHA